jgi:hypothetical protein
MVLQAVVGERQLLLSLPATPLTYHVVLATALAAQTRNITTDSSSITFLFVIKRLQIEKLFFASGQGENNLWSGSNRSQLVVH